MKPNFNFIKDNYHDSFKHLEYGNVLNMMLANPLITKTNSLAGVSLSNFSLIPAYQAWSHSIKNHIFEDIIQRDWAFSCLNIFHEKPSKRALTSPSSSASNEESLFEKLAQSLEIFIINYGSLLFHTFNQVEESQVMVNSVSQNGEFEWKWIHVWMGFLFEVVGDPRLLFDEDDVHIQVLNHQLDVLEENFVLMFLKKFKPKPVFNFQYAPKFEKWYLLGRRWKIDDCKATSIESILTTPYSLTSTLPTRTTLKIMSYNIHNYEGNWKLRLFKILKTIRRQNPDVICFQEVRLDEYKELFNSENDFSAHVLQDHHQISHLKKALTQLGYIHYFHRPAMSYYSPHFMSTNGFPPMMHEEGLAIFSKYPMIESDHRLLYRDVTDPSTHQRISLRSRIIIPFHNDANFITVDIFNTHLSLKEHERNQNVLDLSNFANQVLNHDESNSSCSLFQPSFQLVCGDFNLEPHEHAYSLLQRSGDWRDSFEEARALLFNNTNKLEDFDAHHTLTFSTDETFKKRIDYIVYRTIRQFNTSNDLQVKVHSYQLDGKASEYYFEETNYKAPSDHHAVITEFTIEKV
ncbi:hypothetical protein C9374_014033 [Naegleria lovaniensis]|uniref:Endonuclease/exonuclease/phosphatase domain-containing protein n=1 Tax=Naegleria lovaniensis TaxID=51637 RepID=A0AA88H1W5_NAELO|nr:uncharacterized protein C9374_014033 [Naegleria lovaniensis]KAG2389473.1 hypothetical protein C9374_014033 [Naegleria lovaniensis]